jgi:hypothetical protein
MTGVVPVGIYADFSICILKMSVFLGIEFGHAQIVVDPSTETVPRTVDKVGHGYAGSPAGLYPGYGGYGYGLREC